MEELSEHDEFDSYDEFFTKLVEHGQTHSVQWVKSDSKSVESANRNVSNAALLYDKKFVYRYVRFRCKHGGERREKGTGVRPNQR